MKIDKGVVIPKPKKAGRPAKWPWKQMEAGDSFLMPDNDGKIVSRKSAQSQAHHVLGVGNYATRKEDGGVRIWRIA